jgi:hypothetical protein
MKLRLSLVALPLALFGCAARAHAPAQEPPSGAVAVVDLNALPPPSPPPKQDSPPPAASLDDLEQAAGQLVTLGALNGANDKGAALSSILGNGDALGAEGGVKGSMVGDPIGEAFGVGGLGLTGIGGGGTGQSIGLGSIGTLGHGAGAGTGQGYGAGAGGLGGARAKPPKVVAGAASVNGRLPPEVIQRIVRANFGRFRFCYEKGLVNQPTLQGRINVKFVIDLDGSVQKAANGGSNLPNQAVVTCVVQGFESLIFPKPEGGVVTVVYPLTFEPGDHAAPAVKAAVKAPAPPPAPAKAVPAPPAAPAKQP